MHTNFSLESKDSDATSIPDLSLIATPTTKVHFADYLALAIVECTFSQHNDMLLQKLQLQVATCPDIILVIAIIIEEGRDYSRPKPKLEAWVEFSKWEYLDSCTFLMYSMSNSMVSTDKSDDKLFSIHPITIAGHCWCNMTSVMFHMWIKDDHEKPIVISTRGMVEGVRTKSYLPSSGSTSIINICLQSLGPDINMDDVESVINKGLTKARDYIAAYSRAVSTRSQVEPLENAHVTLSIN